MWVCWTGKHSMLVGSVGETSLVAANALAALAILVSNMGVDSAWLNRFGDYLVTSLAAS